MRFGFGLYGIAGSLVVSTALLAAPVAKAATALSSDCKAVAAMNGQPGMAKAMGAGDMPGMYMLDAATGPMPLVCLTANDPVPPPVYSEIGTATRPVPGGPVVQTYFNQGLQFYDAFNNRESYRAFRYATQIENKAVPCAICYVGEALALGVDINMPTQLDLDRLAAKQALDDANQAWLRDAASGEVNTRELAFIKLLIASLKQRFQDCPSGGSSCQDKRNRDYQASLSAGASVFGNDPDFAVLYADAVMNLLPWSYWNADGTPKLAAVATAKAMLENGMRAYPNHDGLPHWYIHLMEMSGDPILAKPAADELAGLARNAGHLVHMPSHIYYRLGDMSAAIAANRDAIKVDETYFKTQNLAHPDGDRYRYGYYPHNIHFLMAAAAMRGDKAAVTDAAKLLWDSPPPNADGFRADRYRAVYYLGLANLADADAITHFLKPQPEQPFAQVAYDYTQLLAAIMIGRSGDVTKAQDALAQDADTYRKLNPSESNPRCLTGALLPADINLCLVSMMEDIGQAKIDATGPKPWAATAKLVLDAVAIQDRLPYDEPPPWLFPVRQTLAGLALQRRKTGAKDVDNAVLAGVYDELRKALPPMVADHKPVGSGVFPGDGWTYYALWQIDVALKRDETADKAAFLANWAGGTASPPAFNRF